MSYHGIPPSQRPRWQRALWLAGGGVFLLTGIVGIFLPLLPTTPFVLLAAWCFSRGSVRWEAWLLAHPRFGPMVADWRARRAIPMRAKQWPAGLRMVVACGLPVAVNMALRAVLAHRATVRVVLAVASLAVLRQARLHLAAGVAAIALEHGVCAGQPESRPAVVEVVDLGPVARDVTVCATLAEAPAMAIVVAVAGHALLRGLAALRSFGVAILARRRDMLAVEGEVGQGVVETGLVQQRDRAVQAQVVAVAGRAGLLRLVPVQAASGLDIAGRVFMAREAQLRLGIAVEGRMAALAFGFVLLVRARHRTRHQCPFEGTGVRCAGQPQAQPCQNADQ